MKSHLSKKIISLPNIGFQSVSLCSRLKPGVAKQERNKYHGKPVLEDSRRRESLACHSI